MSQSPYDRAANRVNKNKRLAAHAAIILYDWNDPEHWEWVATAPISEIVDWAEAVTLDEMDRDNSDNE